MTASTNTQTLLRLVVNSIALASVDDSDASRRGTPFAAFELQKVKRVPQRSGTRYQMASLEKGVTAGFSWQSDPAQAG